jgi:hypothetical protein
MPLQTEFEFILPCGYVDEQGDLHRHGTMRRATALDEVAPMGDARVRTNEAYLSIVLLSRVIKRVGMISPVSADIVERLFATDFIYLQDLYTRVNDGGSNLIETQCPVCQTRFMLNLEAAEALQHG